MRALFKMTRDLILLTFLLFVVHSVVHCNGAEGLVSENDGINKSNWVCDLGRTKGVVLV